MSEKEFTISEVNNSTGTFIYLRENEKFVRCFYYHDEDSKLKAIKEAIEFADIIKRCTPTETVIMKLN